MWSFSSSTRYVNVFISSLKNKFRYIFLTHVILQSVCLIFSNLNVVLWWVNILNKAGILLTGF